MIPVALGNEDDDDADDVLRSSLSSRVWRFKHQDEGSVHGAEVVAGIPGTLRVKSKAQNWQFVPVHEPVTENLDEPSSA